MGNKIKSELFYSLSDKRLECSGCEKYYTCDGPTWANVKNWGGIKHPWPCWVVGKEEEKENRENFCYTVLEHQYDAEGFIPSTVFEGESGHYPMTGQGECSSPWHWGKTFEQAKEVCQIQNERLGLTREDVVRITLSSF